ncbi:uncharacterized protein LOC18028574 [Eutrema salsugineum]|uniref:uncharacterized protein LOC18028574 n=1 Tax=Eutrema salsugineum TaxID=72664 RepID=UPI000CED5F81|nr:uncharacterized protein LOC18028574 [Eutrema salsugineum]
MLNEVFDQVLSNKDEVNVPLSRSKVLKPSTEEAEKKQRKRKNDSIDEMPVKKKKELEWRPEDCAKPVGKLINSTGVGRNKKCHYEKFEFRDQQYGLEDSVLLIPEDVSRKPYVAIIKDIYVQGKEGHVKLEVQWFYRPEDVEKKYVKWESNDARDLFYSFHRDEVYAESVKHSCIVYFVPENMQIPDSKKHPGFIVQNVYNTIKKKLWKFTHDGFNKQQKHEINLLVAKTISRVGDLPDIEKEQKHEINLLVAKTISRVGDLPDVEKEQKTLKTSRRYKSILEKFDMLTGDLDRDKKLEELLEAVKHKCRLTEKKQATDYDSFWPDDVVPVVRALEQVFYDSMSKDIPEYNRKLEVLVDKLKVSLTHLSPSLFCVCVHVLLGSPKI